MGDPLVKHDYRYQSIAGPDDHRHPSQPPWIEVGQRNRQSIEERGHSPVDGEPPEENTPAEQQHGLSHSEGDCLIGRSGPGIHQYLRGEGRLKYHRDRHDGSTHHGSREAQPGQRRTRLPSDGAMEGQQAPNQQEYARVDDNVSARHDRVVHYRLKDRLAVVDVSGCDPGCDQRRKSR